MIVSWTFAGDSLGFLKPKEKRSWNGNTFDPKSSAITELALDLDSGSPKWGYLTKYIEKMKPKDCAPEHPRD